MPTSLTEWVTLVSVIATILLGGGGIGALIKIRNDQKNGVKQETRADSDSLNARSLAILESQFTYLVKPLEERVNTQSEEIETLKTELEEIRKEAHVISDLYRSALEHIRLLYGWIARHLPEKEDTENPVPVPPSKLERDLNLNG